MSVTVPTLSLDPEAFRLAEVYERLEVLERDLVLEFAKRLLWGQSAYGPFGGNDGRNMKREAIEEALDGFVYVARLLQRSAHAEESAE